MADVIDPEQRKAILGQAVAQHVAVGWQVEYQADDRAVLAAASPPVNHVLHLLLTLVTCGLWAIVWFVLALSRPPARRLTLAVDERGQISRF